MTSQRKTTQTFKAEGQHPTRKTLVRKGQPKPQLHTNKAPVGTCDCGRDTQLVWKVGAIRRHICHDCAALMGGEW